MLAALTTVQRGLPNPRHREQPKAASAGFANPEQAGLYAERADLDGPAPVKGNEILLGRSRLVITIEAVQP